MGLNNKGFAISTILYSLLVMATLILFLLIGNFSFERRTTSNLVTNIESGLNDLQKIITPIQILILMNLVPFLKFYLPMLVIMVAIMMMAPILS